MVARTGHDPERRDRPVLLVLAVIVLEWRLHKLSQARLADKDKEIKRVVEARDKLQEIILTKRLATEKPPKGGNHD